jgi:hypothetical protein
MSYWKLIPSLWSKKNSNYGFVNEVQVRIWAGLMFTVWFFTFLSVYYAGKYDLALVVVAIFWLDFVLKVINPRYSLVGKIANMINLTKEPVRVGAIQKRFARALWLTMSSVVLIMLIKHNFFMDASHQMLYGTITPPMILCLVCLSLMWLESILWYCVGCSIFEYLVDKKILKNTDNQSCPDGHCSL